MHCVGNPAIASFICTYVLWEVDRMLKLSKLIDLSVDT